MRALLLPMLVVTAQGSTLTPDDACRFIGSRFARVESTCEMGVCTNVRQLESGEYVSLPRRDSTVSCEKAQADSTSFFAEQVVPGHHSRQRSAPGETFQAVIDALQNTVLPLLEELAFGTELKPEMLNPALLSVDQLMFSLITGTGDKWTRSTIGAILGSDALRRMRTIYLHIIRDATQRALTYPGLLRCFHSAIHFYFDIAALLTAQFISATLAERARVAIGPTEPGYRAITRWEQVHPPVEIGVPASVNGAVQVSSVIESLALSSVAMPIHHLVIGYTLFLGWTESPPSSSKALLQDQIVSSICPRLVGMVGEMAQTQYRIDPLIRITVSFLEECRAVLPMQIRRAIVEIMTKWGQKSSHQIALPEDASTRALLADSPLVAWDLGLSSGNPHIRAQALLREFMVENASLFLMTGKHLTLAFNDDIPANSRGFGRAMGLAILHGTDLKHLRLSPLIAKWLHPRARRTACRLAGVAVAIAPMTTSALVLVAAGIDEVLGRGGLEIFTDAEWLDLFGIAL